jgi:hypothetical protein
MLAVCNQKYLHIPTGRITDELNTIVLELECLVSRQWQEQIRGFQPGQPAGCSWKKISGCRNIQEYQGI